MGLVARLRLGLQLTQRPEVDVLSERVLIEHFLLVWPSQCLQFLLFLEKLALVKEPILVKKMLDRVLHPVLLVWDYSSLKGTVVRT